MNTYLLTFNPQKSGWKNLDDDWKFFVGGNEYFERWSCGNTQKIRIGDRVFLMRLGEEPKGIMLSGWVVEEPFPDAPWSDEGTEPPLYIWFVVDAFLNPATQEILDPRTIQENMNWFPQRSGVTIPVPVAEELERRWRKHLAHEKSIQTFLDVESILDEQLEETQFREGSERLYSIRAYERNPAARSRCIETHGLNCSVCGFNFEKQYGSIGQNYIHIHHMKALAELREEHLVDPTKDMRPVCPNCHAMLHRRFPPYSIEELRSMINIVQNSSLD